MRPEKALRYYQRWMERMIRQHPGILLSVPMGFGKTGAALTAVRKLLLAGEVIKVLIVAPLRVASDTWPDEILEWEHTCEIPFTLIRAEDRDPEIISAGKRAYDRIQGVVGGMSKLASRARGYAITDAKTAKRERLAMEETSIHIINREAIPWLVKFFGRKWPYDMLIYDEASRLKEGRFRTEGGKKYAKVKGPRPLSEFGSLVKVRHAFKRVVELSGTPSPNGEIDLWGPIYMIDRGERLGRTKTAFKKRWFDENPYTYETTARPGAIDDITNRIKDVMFSLDEDELDLPPVIFNNINVRLDPEHLRQYRQFEADLVSEAYDVEAVSKGVLSNKLLQFCIAEGTEVLTSRGWIAIQDVSASDLIWDGVEWVNHGGLLNQGERYIIQSYGVYMTPDHEVLTTRGWMSGHGANCVGFDRAEVRLPYSFGASRDQRQPASAMVLCLSLWNLGSFAKSISEVSASFWDKVVRMRPRSECFLWSRAGWTHDDGFSPVGNMVGPEESMSKSKGQGFQELRRSWNRHARSLVSSFLGFLGGCAGRLRGMSSTRPDRREQVVFDREYKVDNFEGEWPKQTGHYNNPNKMGKNIISRGCGKIRSTLYNCLQAMVAWGLRGLLTKNALTFDIADCGPRNQFVVRGLDGPLIVHNCNGSMYRNVPGKQREVIHIHDKKLDALESIIEEEGRNPILVAYSFKFDLERIRKRFKHAVVFDEEPDFVKKWNSGKIRLALAHPASIGHGLNLQYGGHIAVWYGLTWSLELYLQFNKRLPRPGQKNKHVMIHHILAEGTNDFRQLTSLRTKGITQDQINASTRAHLHGLAEALNRYPNRPEFAHRLWDLVG